MFSFAPIGRWADKTAHRVDISEAFSWMSKGPGDGQQVLLLSGSFFNHLSLTTIQETQILTGVQEASEHSYKEKLGKEWDIACSTMWTLSSVFAPTPPVFPLQPSLI